ncbi:helix-turn-helix domain-containing protein [Saccharopolyspora phatthalungensis]|uniref:Transcriptional regulator with XRE-family HTH domain n=1 Tax=Saccharopolyspora phatthalungensis TaxID=664693 RepID=A0A840PV93_9PSEU|nr:helix-turn-helix transcriptional regulator [Saccharopolyspora phatthalungensis]MBB5154202.1 transcriptional regulator with XRE-family HTH domain [Saccharopolyspora phatthalungensis]
MPPNSPTVANWALGRRLREIREEAGLASGAASKLIGVTSAYLSEAEHGKKTLALEKLDTLMAEYGIEDAEAQELRALREQAVQRGWWAKYSGIFSNDLLRFFGFEHGAEAVHAYDSGVINGLLQTEDYAQAISEASTGNLRLAEVDRRVSCRMTRQLRLTGEDPLRFNVVMSEAVLRQEIGGPDVLKAQLEHILALIDKHPDTLDVRIVPFSASGHEAMGGSAFYLMTFPNGRLPTVLWQETVTSTHLIIDPIMVREYAIAHTAATQAALNREESRTLIKKVSTELPR